MLVAQGRVVQADAVLSFCAARLWAVVRSTGGAGAPKKTAACRTLVRVLHLLLPMRLSSGRLLRHSPNDLLDQLRGTLSAGAHHDHELDRLDSLYRPLSAAIACGDPTAFDARFRENVAEYERRGVAALLHRCGKTICYWQLFRKVVKLVRGHEELLKLDNEFREHQQKLRSAAEGGPPEGSGAAEQELLDPGVGRFTVANTKAISLEVFFQVVSGLEPRMIEPDVISVLAQLIHAKALRGYISWNQGGVVLDAKNEPFPSVGLWIEAAAA